MFQYQQPQQVRLSNESQILLQQKQSLEGLTIHSKYIITNKIQDTIYGQLYKANFQKNEYGQSVQVYQLNGSKFTNSTMRQIKNRFKLLQFIKHQNVLPCYDIIQSQRYLIIVMKYYQQGTLQSEILRHQALQLNYAINILEQICLGLLELHHNKIIHGNLKPENIFINNFKYLVSDFGLSKFFQTPFDDVSQAPQISDTNYNFYGIQADIYSLGMILFVMLYPQGNFIHRYKKAKSMIQSGNICFRMKNGNMIPKYVQQFLKKSLHSDPQKRLTWNLLCLDEMFQKNSLIPSNQIVETSCSILSIQTSNIPTNLSIRKIISPQNYSQTNLQVQVQLNQIQLIETTTQKLESTKKKLKQRQQTEKKNNEKQQQMIIFKKRSLWILQKMINKIQQKKLLDLSINQNVQLMYLLSSRCFWNVSYVFNRYNQCIGLKESQFYYFYQLCNRKYKQYSRKLTAIENKKGISTQCIYYSGLQNLDFKMVQFIKFTQNVLNKIIKFNTNNSNQNVQMLIYFSIFQRIHQLSYFDIGQISYQDIFNQQKKKRTK